MRRLFLVSLLALAKCPSGAVGVSAAPPGAGTATRSDCVPADFAPDKCANLLERGWQQYSDADAAKLEQAIRAMLPAQPKPNLDVVVQKKRRSISECRKADNSTEGQTVDVEYIRPAAMEVFPSGGTRDRELVVAVFNDQRDDGCAESRYGVAHQRGRKWERQLTFTVVNTKPSAAPKPEGEPDVVLGEWQTWVIEATQSKKNYRLHEVRRGAYVRCGFPHSQEDYGNVAFITCDDGHRLHARADSTVGASVRDAETRRSLVEQEFARLIAGYNAGDSTVTKGLRSVATEAPAWGRCGKLGCCASY